MSSEIVSHQPEYSTWLGELKTRFRRVQLKAAVAVNTALLQFYWELGADMVERQQQYARGQGFVVQLSADLMREFPDVKGFSERNLKYIRQWHLFWREAAIGQQPVAQLIGIPWGHNLAILSKCKRHDEALYYVQATQAYGWSRNVLVHQIESGLWEKAVDKQLRRDGDQPTIGLLLCKSKDRLVAEYALSDIQKPMGLATYTLSHTLPESLQGELPNIEQLERELGLEMGTDGGSETGGLEHEF